MMRILLQELQFMPQSPQDTFLTIDSTSTDSESTNLDIISMMLSVATFLIFQASYKIKIHSAFLTVTLCFCINFHMPTFKNSLITTNRQKVNRIILTDAILIFHVFFFF
jgi:hypothetical protein